MSFNFIYESLQSTQGVLPARKKWWGRAPCFLKPLAIYDQNLRFSLSYLWPDRNFNTLFMTIAADTVA